FFGSLTQAGWLITLHAQWDGPTRRNDNDPECPAAIWRDPRHERRTHASCPPDREISPADGPACLGPDPWCSPAASGSVHGSRGSRGAAASGHHCTDRRPGCLPRGRQHEQVLRLPQVDLLNDNRRLLWLAGRQDSALLLFVLLLRDLAHGEALIQDFQRGTGRIAP